MDTDGDTTTTPPKQPNPLPARQRQPAGDDVRAALDTCADRLFGQRTATAPTALSEAIVVGVRRAAVMGVAMVFGNDDTRAAAYRADAILEGERRARTTRL